MDLNWLLLLQGLYLAFSYGTYNSVKKKASNHLFTELKQKEFIIKYVHFFFNFVAPVYQK